MKLSFNSHISAVTKVLTWRRFDFINNTPPLTSDGKKYLCLDIHGVMQVCTWDGIVQEWTFPAGEMVSDPIIDVALECISGAVIDLLHRHLPKSKWNSICIEDIASLSLEHKSTAGLQYFDYVEWYMELPDAPVIDSFDVDNADDIQAAIFDKHLSLMEHLEKAVVEFTQRSAAKSEVNDAP